MFRSLPNPNAGTLRLTATPRMGNLRGFTLLELLIILAIIGLICAILIPSMYRLRIEAKAKGECRENIVRIDAAKERYASELHLAARAHCTFADLIRTGNLSTEPHCPMGGTYALGDIGEQPTCSHGELNKAHMHSEAEDAQAHRTAAPSG